MSVGEDLEPQLKTAQAEAEHARREVAELRVRLGSIERDKQIRAERIRHAIAEITRWQSRQAQRGSASSIARRASQRGAR